MFYIVNIETIVKNAEKHARHMEKMGETTLHDKSNRKKSILNSLQKLNCGIPKIPTSNLKHADF